MRPRQSREWMGCRFERVNELSATLGQGYSPPREEGWLRHQENFGEANLNAAAGVVAHVDSVSDHPVRSFKGRLAASSRRREFPMEEGIPSNSFTGSSRHLSSRERDFALDMLTNCSEILQKAGFRF